jgi:hypothetical protein
VGITAAEIRAREARWAKPVGIASLLAVLLLIGSGFFGASISGDGAAELLRSAHEHTSSVGFSGALNALAFLLLTAPLLYLFRAVQGRGERVIGALVGLVVLAPVCLAISSGLGAAARQDAADSFVDGEASPTLTKAEATKECASERGEKSASDFAGEYDIAKGETPLAACERTKIEDDTAENATSDASLSSIAGLFGIVGGISLVISLFYVSLWAMRTGLLGRFWASLGMALGITVLLGIILFALLWFAYVGLLIAGWLPGGRPPAWEEGEAVPWPSPGQKAAEDLEGPEGFDEHDAPELEAGEEPGGEPGDDPPDGPPRKRKRRD